MDKQFLELYSDYLLSSFSYTTATGMSIIFDGEISHDKFTRFLRTEELTSVKLWGLVKKTVRKIESEEGVLEIDDTIEEKPYTDENAVVCWHYDHSKGRSVKGINIVSALYYSNDISIPVGFDIVKKMEIEIDEKTLQEKRKSKRTKNEMYCDLLKACVKNNLKFKYVLNDVWYASADNMNFTKKEMKKDFVMPLKSNRKIALNEKDKLNGKYVTAGMLELKQDETITVYIEGVKFPLLLAKQIFKNEDGTEGILYLVSSDLKLTYDQITAIYQKRWKVERYHQSLKMNAGLCKSPTKTIRTQTNHVFASIYAFFKLECLRIINEVNHFAMRAKIYYKATKVAFEEVQKLTIQLALK